jgi:hypothetical protein
MFSRGSDVTQVFHLWANQSKDSGRRADGRVYFQGPAFYSFGRHYVAAYRIGDFALFNASKYSSTTTGHVSACRSAASHLSQINVPDLTGFVDRFERAARAYSYATAERVAKTPAMLAKDKAAAAIQHVTKCALAYGDKEDHWGLSLADAAALLSLCGVKNAPAVWTKIRAAAEKAEAKKEAEHKRTAERNLLERARQYADQSPSDFRAEIMAAADRTYQRRVYGKYDWRTGTSNPDHMETSGALVELRKAITNYHRAAKKAGLSKKRVSTLWTRVLACRAAVENFETLKRIQARRSGMKTAIGHFRQGLAELAKGPERRPFTSAVWRTWIEALDKIFTSVRLSHASAAHLAVLRSFAATEAAATVERERVAAAAFVEAQRVQREREKAERVERERQAREDWFRGLRASWRGSDESGRAYVRAVDVQRDDSGRVIGGTLETSHGADVPLTHAIKAFRFIKLCRETGKPWSRNGRTVRVGHFQIDSIDSTGNFRAGCHQIGWTEVERVARALGVFELAASDAAAEHETA